MASTAAHPLPGTLLKLNVGFLVHGPVGTTCEFPFDLPAISLGDDLVAAGIQGTLQISRTSEGLWAQGRMHIPYQGECSRCLGGLSRVAQIDLEELFGIPGVLLRSGATEFFIREDGMLNLQPVLRAELMIDAENRVFCREDCAGLCPQCGQNLNEAACHCPPPSDPRWSSLAELLPNPTSQRSSENE
ncbi:MAG: DUF177 domain-containing protein [Anaerolineaceae bacterium]|nr:DUF177 domain-containing protein [Anaerolineaceae bacterium]MCY3936207.1 DUF177 domain-containing protein [Chloroflexota bacterium]MCY4010070.1 DUF177 domain-containing protein [Anaerolineaceae bacterium]MCY4107136.1 DUF177 domain-containing protein [Chloroflexota bacterium]